jgi:glycosyltransferase involved in cell wall biosynthesis
VFPAFSGGGPEVRTAGIVNKTSDLFRHTVLSLSPELSGRSMLKQCESVSCHSLASTSLWSLRRALQSLRPDLVLTYGWGGTDAILAARLAGIKRILHCEDGFLDDEVGQQKPLRRWARRILFQAAQALIVPSQSLCRIARDTWRVSDRALRYIPNGVDTVRFRPPELAQRTALRAALEIPSNAVVVGTVGALRPEKNQTRLLHAFAAIAGDVPNYHLLVVGAGPLREIMNTAAQQHKIEDRVTFSGRTNDPVHHYQAMDVFALSSDTEQMPLVLLEAMATGLPVVSTDVGDCREMVTLQNRAWIVEAGNDRAYAERLQNLLLDAGLRKQLGNANRERCVLEYSLDKMLRNYSDLYHASVAESPKHAQSSVG